MKIIIYVLIAFIFFFPPFSYAEIKQELSKMDGTDWAEWQPIQKYSFISGFMAGAHYVLTNNTQDIDDNFDREKASNVFISYFLPDAKKPKNSYSRKEVALLLGNQTNDTNISLSRYAIFQITNGQLVEGLNAFYGDFKNKQIKITDAVYVVKKQIKGASDEETEAVLQFLRADKDFKKLSYTDKDGKKKYASFP